MVVCVECGAEVADLWSWKFGALVLTRCKACGEVADKYLEFETVLKAFDLILHKIQIYRHLLFNVDAGSQQKPTRLQSHILRLGFICCLLDAYSVWLRGEHADSDLASVATEYLGVVCSHGLGLLVALGTTAALVQALYGASTMAVVNALILSSFCKLFHIGGMIWEYRRNFSEVVDVFTFSSNVVALRALLHTGPVQASLLVAGGQLCRMATGTIIGWLT